MSMKAELFLTILSKLIKEGKVRIVDRNDTIIDTGIPIVGFTDKKNPDAVYIIPKIAVNAVNKETKEIIREICMVECDEA